MKTRFDPKFIASYDELCQIGSNRQPLSGLAIVILPSGRGVGALGWKNRVFAWVLLVGSIPLEPAKKKPEKKPALIFFSQPPIFSLTNQTKNWWFI